MRKPDMTDWAVLREADIPLEVVIQIVGGMAMLIAGGLLFPASDGILPYYANGFYGLLLIIFALQMITMGKTPVGDMPRSLPVLAAGVLIAAVGIVTCFVPIPVRLPRVLLFLSLGPGGFLLFLQMCSARDKLRSWSRFGGLFTHLILGCTAVYLLSMLMALLLWQRRLLTVPLGGVVVLISGAAILYLAGVLRKIYRMHPEAETRSRGGVDLSTDQAMLLLTGVFMVLLGVLLVPVGAGLIPFSGSAQLGLLMVIFAVQMLASGNTPLGAFRRSRLVVGFGLVFAALGVVSCIIPEILVPALTILVGVLNILGGVGALARMRGSRSGHRVGTREPVPPVLERLSAAQLTMNLLSITFGVSMLLPGMVPVPVVGVILAMNGCVLLYLLSILVALDKVRGTMGRAT